MAQNTKAAHQNSFGHLTVPQKASARTMAQVRRVVHNQDTVILRVSRCAENNAKYRRSGRRQARN